MADTDLEWTERVQEDVEKLRNDLDVVIWLHAELMYGLRVAALQQALSNPQVREQLMHKLAEAGLV